MDEFQTIWRIMQNSYKYFSIVESYSIFFTFPRTVPVERRSCLDILIYNQNFNLQFSYVYGRGYFTFTFINFQSVAIRVLCDDENFNADIKRTNWWSLNFGRCDTFQSTFGESCELEFTSWHIFLEFYKLACAIIHGTPKKLVQLSYWYLIGTDFKITYRHGILQRARQIFNDFPSRTTTSSLYFDSFHVSGPCFSKFLLMIT